MEFLGEYWSSPAILDERIFMFLARDLTFGSMSPDEDEFIDSVKIPLKDLVEMIMEGKIPDGKTQTAVLKTLYKLGIKERH